MLLGDAKLFANVAVSDTEKAKKFYGEVLGLELIDENMAVLTYKSTEGKLFVYTSPTAGSGQATCVTWQVEDVKAIADELAKKGVIFEHYEMPNIQHDGVVHIMGEYKSAWFKDPDGNVLCIAGGGE